MIALVFDLEWSQSTSYREIFSGGLAIIWGNISALVKALWKILSMMIGKMSQLKSELPRKSQRKICQGYKQKLFQNLTNCLEQFQRLWRRVQTFAAYISGEADSIHRPTFSSFSHDLSSMLNAYNGNILGIELMEMSTNCTSW